MCCVENDAAPAEVDETQSVVPLFVLETPDLAQ